MNKSKVVIGRYINGISLNDLEYAMNESGNILEFNDLDSAKNFLLEKGETEEGLYCYIFEDAETGEKLT